MSDRLPSAPVLGGLAQVGKYFQLISIVPASVVVFSTYAFLASGAPAEEPSWRRLGASVGDLDFGEASLFAIAVLVVGMTLHPFQFAATQLLEGYWGTHSIALTAMATKARIHLERRRSYSLAAQSATKDAEAAGNVVAAQHDLVAMHDAEAAELKLWLNVQEFENAYSRYPPDADRVMPTRLGNVLRRYEDLAGQPYGLDALAIAPHLMHIAEPEQTAHVDDARTQLDLAIRFVLSWVIVSIVGFLLLWPYGPWLALPLSAYGLAWLSYRASVLAAEEYGVAVFVLFDLNHAALLDRFKPVDITDDALRRAEEISHIAARTYDNNSALRV